MRVIIAADALADLADQAAMVARSHAPRTPARRAAAALWVSLITTSTVDGARSALTGFAAPDVVADALELLHRLAVRLASPEDVPAAQGDGAAPTGRNRP